MLILTIRTDKPEAELGLYDDDTEITYEKWEAHRQLAETIHIKLAELLQSQAKGLSELGGIVIFKGPGSFTGLRIGVSVANSLASSLAIPIVACDGEAWVSVGIAKLRSGDNDVVALPEYGALPHITQPKK